MSNVAKSFRRGGRRYFLQGQQWPTKYQDIVQLRWEPPFHRCSGRAGGHISALRPHLSNNFFARIDLADFFENITDTKIYRALRMIGISHWTAFEMAGRSSVEIGKRRVLARGFHQSPLLADLVLDQSLLGSVLRNKTTSTVTTYADDIILSSKNSHELKTDFANINAAISKANFKCNQQKTTSPCQEVIAFNIIMKSGELSLTKKRFDLFKRQIEWHADRISCDDEEPFEEEIIDKQINLFYIDQIRRYVSSINNAQGEEINILINALVGSNASRPIPLRSTFYAGKRVFHQKFGLGTVKAVSKHLLTIDFDEAGPKVVLDRFLQVEED